MDSKSNNERRGGENNGDIFENNVRLRPADVMEGMEGNAKVNPSFLSKNRNSAKVNRKISTNASLFWKRKFMAKWKWQSAIRFPHYIFRSVRLQPSFVKQKRKKDSRGQNKRLFIWRNKSVLVKTSNAEQWSACNGNRVRPHPAYDFTTFARTTMDII